MSYFLLRIGTRAWFRLAHVPTLRHIHICVFRTDPSKVLGFLDAFGVWDPTLGFVMAVCGCGIAR